MKSFAIITIISAINIFCQSERLTNGLENGQAWIRMEDSAQPYSTSKLTYLNSIVERYRLTQEKHPELISFNCKQEINRLFAEGKSNKISMSDIVKEIDKYYSDEMNMIIPIIFAYCYTIKKIAGASEEDILNYKSEVLKFCEE